MKTRKTLPEHKSLINNYIFDVFLWIGEVLHLDMAYFARGSYYGALQQIIGLLSGFGVSYLFGHFVSKTVFGEYNLILSIVAMLTFFSLPGIDDALTQSVGKGHDASFQHALQKKLKFSQIGSIILLIIAVYYGVNRERGLAWGSVTAAIFYPYLNAFPLYINFLNVKKQFSKLAFISIASSLTFLGLMALVAISRATTLKLTLAYLTGITLPALIGYWYSLRFIKKKSVPDSRLVSYGSFLTVISVLPWISGNLGNVILGNTLGPEALAVFVVANRFLATVQKNFIVFYNPISAKLATQTDSGHYETLKIHLFKFILIGVGLFVALWISLPYLIRFFYPIYPEAVTYGKFLSFALIPLPITWVLHDIVLFQKRRNIQVLSSTLPQIIKIGLYIILIPVWKIDGLIAATLFERYFGLAVLALVMVVKRPHKVVL